MSYDASSTSVVTVLMSTRYSPGEARGVGLLVAAGALSLLSVIGLLIIMAVSAYRTKGSRDDHVFVRTHVAAYFVSLLICDMAQGVGSLINIAWINNGGVTNNSLCVAQGAIKQTGNVGTALWSFVIAVHTFFLLFYRTKVPDGVCYTTLVVVWCILGGVLSLGPGVFATKEKGPFYGISGLWCWMTSQYPIERYALEYCFMFASAGLSFILYTLVFLRLRGNVNVTGWRFSFQRRHVAKGYSNKQYNVVTDPSQNTHVMRIARQMMWYPVAYTILIVPIAAARFASFSGKSVPYEVTIFTATVFMLSGFVNAVLFTATRRVVPASSIFPAWMRERFGISTGTGIATHQRSMTNNISMSRTSKHVPHIGIDVTVNVEKEYEYDLETPGKRGSFQLSQPVRPFDVVAPFNNQALGSPTATGRKIVWDDQGKSQTSTTIDIKRSSSVGSSNSDMSKKPSPDAEVPYPMQYPSPPNTYRPPISHSTSPNIAAYLNPRDRGDRGMSAAYGYAGQDVPLPEVAYTPNQHRPGRGI